MGIASGISHLFQAIVETIQGIFAAILNVFQEIFGAISHVFQFVLSTITGVFHGFVNFVEGTLGFAFHNFFIIGTGVAVVLGYMLYKRRTGTAPASRAVKS
jgi:phage-related protein